MKKLLIEILSEEIPARFQVEACEQFKSLVEGQLAEYGFTYSNIEADSTPRRMYFLADVAELSEAKTVEKRGPLASASVKAVEGFLASSGITMENCTARSVNGKTYLFATVTNEPEHFTNVLGGIIDKVVHAFKWPKSMHWSDKSFMWARPLRNIMCVYGEQVLRYQISGLGLCTNNVTCGHRFMGEKKIEISSASKYKQKMAENNVILTRAERLSRILAGFDQIEKAYGVKVNRHNGLLGEIIGLVEYPKLFVGEISNEFMHLPEEVLTASMRINQRYFTTNNHEGNISRYFVFVSNIETVDNGETVIRGNQRVLSARLSDAKFFFEQDLKRPLESYLPELKRVMFHEGIGTVYDRVSRLKQIAKELSYLSDDPDGLLRAVTLSKCDLKTSMVNEFTELQGIIGGHYARIQQESEYVHRAIYEQYLPLGNNIPKTNGGILLSIIDKIDLLVGFFSVYKAPTGSKDPFGLRRAAIGILKMIITNKLNITNLKNVIKSDYQAICRTFPETKLDPDTVEKVMNFIKDKLITIAADSGISKAVCSVFWRDDSILSVFDKATALHNREDLDKLVSLFKRAYSFASDVSLDSIDTKLFEDASEQKLYDVLNSPNCSFELLYEIATVFFDSVLVNVEDQKIKKNRLTLVAKLLAFFSSHGDFSKLI